MNEIENSMVSPYADDDIEMESIAEECERIARERARDDMNKALKDIGGCLDTSEWGPDRMECPNCKEISLPVAGGECEECHQETLFSHWWQSIDADEEYQENQL
jgi:hypothetical protein